MFPPSIRMKLIGLSIVAGIVALNQGRETWLLYFGAAIIFAFEPFKGGSIWLAFQAYRKQNFDKFRKYLSATKNPDWLRPSSRAYYHFLNGVISTIDKDYKKAKDSL